MSSHADTKEKLLNTALKLLWASSYGRVSVDEICEHAGCKKGSFYHYFKSKADLAIDAMEHEWITLKKELDRLFSPASAPIDRLKNYAEFSAGIQRDGLKEFGYVPGCPYASLGSEQCSEDDGLRKKANEVLNRFKKYFDSAIRDAIEERSIPAVNPQKKALQLYTYYTGVNTLARLANSISPFEELWDGWRTILFAQDAEKSA